MDERREKLFYVGCSDMLRMLQWRERNFVSLPEFPELPQEARITQVNFDFMRNAFVLIVQHPDFDPVPAGEALPSIDGLLNFRGVTVSLEAGRRAVQLERLLREIRLGPCWCVAATGASWDEHSETCQEIQRVLGEGSSE